MTHARETDTPPVRLICDRLADIAQEDPDRALVFDPVFGRFTYADMHAQVRRLAHGLVAHGIGPGDVVILQLPNWAPFLTFHIALTAIGAVTALVPFVYREHEIRGAVALTGARALVIPDEYRSFSYRRMAERVRSACPDLRQVLLVGGGSGAGGDSGDSGDTGGSGAIGGDGDTHGSGDIGPNGGNGDTDGSGDIRDTGSSRGAGGHAVAGGSGSGSNRDTDNAGSAGGEPDSDGGFIDYAALMAEPWERTVPCDLAALAPGVDDLTAIGFTSGTTGDLKGVMFDTRVLAAVNHGFVERYGLCEHDRILGGSPLGHAVGFTHALRMTLTIGGSIVLQQRWEPSEAIELIRRERCTYMAAATPFLMDIIGHPALAQAGHLPSLRLFLCGGASIPEQLAHDAERALPHTFTSPLWGMTECGGVTTCPFDAPAQKRHTTDGTPCGGMALKVVDTSGAEVPRGVEGELMARGPMVARGYYGRDDLTRESFLPDGFFRTGDQARMDEDGYIRITGRIKDLVIRGGVNIAPAEIESVLFSHPRVANAAVVGMPDPRLGERVCAFVIPDPAAAGDCTLALTVEEVQGWMQAAGLAKPKWPERVEVVDAFPMTASGKVQKFRLREWIAAKLNAETGRTA